MSLAPSAPPHQAVPLQGLNQGAIGVSVQHQPVLQILQEVQVLEGRPGLLPLLLGGPALVRGALQVVLEVHADGAGQHVVHHHHANVLPARLHTVQPKEFGQKGPGVLVQILGGRRSDVRGKWETAREGILTSWRDHTSLNAGMHNAS